MAFMKYGNAAATRQVASVTLLAGGDRVMVGSCTATVVSVDGNNVVIVGDDGTQMIVSASSVRRI